MYEDIEEKGIRRTIISFDPFLKRADVRDLSDTQVGSNRQTWRRLAAMWLA